MKKYRPSLLTLLNLITWIAFICLLKTNDLRLLVISFIGNIAFLILVYKPSDYEFFKNIFKSKKKSPDNKYYSLRQTALNLSSVASPVQPNEDGVYAFVMENTIEGGTSTLVVVADGAVSQYFSNGNAVIGCGTHEQVQKPARVLMSYLKKDFTMFQSLSNPPLPALGLTHFYFITTQGNFIAASRTEDLQYEDHILYPYFVMSQMVISEIRKLYEQSSVKF